MRALAAYSAEATGNGFNLLTHGANGTGAWLAGAVPHREPGGKPTTAGKNTAQMLGSRHRTYLLWGFEPDYDVDDPASAMETLAQADTVIAAATFATDSLRDVASLILPLAPPAEGEGSMVNFDGTILSFGPAGRPLGEARAGWKISA